MQKTNIAGLDRLLSEARRQVAAMTPKQYEEMLARQRESFVRAMTTPCEHGALDFEQCPKCRAPAPPSPKPVVTVGGEDE